MQDNVGGCTFIYIYYHIDTPIYVLLHNMFLSYLHLSEVVDH